MGLLEHVTVRIPALPPALEGMRIAHATDLHFYRAAAGRRIERVREALGHERFDLLFLTGDFMDHAGHEALAAKHVTAFVEGLKPQIGIVGVFGNHDTRIGRERLRETPGVHWLENQWLDPKAMPLPDGLAIAGLDTESTHDARPSGVECDAVALATAPGSEAARRAAVRLALCHKHVHLPALADMRFDVVFSGHTHGGQCRLPFPWNHRGALALTNSTDWPLHLTSGLIRHRRSVAVVSRGMGETTLRLRVFCPMHLLMVELRGESGPRHDRLGVHNERPW